MRRFLVTAVTVSSSVSVSTSTPLSVAVAPVDIVASSVWVGSLMSDDTEETAMEKAGCAVAPSLSPTFTSGGRGVANVSMADEVKKL